MKVWFSGVINVLAELRCNKLIEHCPICDLFHRINGDDLKLVVSCVFKCIALVINVCRELGALELSELEE